MSLKKRKKKHMLTEQIGISGKFVPNDVSNFKYAFFRKNNNNKQFHFNTADNKSLRSHIESIPNSSSFTHKRHPQDVSSTVTYAVFSPVIKYIYILYTYILHICCKPADKISRFF